MKTRPPKPAPDVTQQSFSDLLDLMIAAEMARIYQLNVAGRIKKISRRIRNRTKDPAMEELCRLTIKAPDSRVLHGITMLYDEMVKDGVLEQA